MRRCRECLDPIPEDVNGDLCPNCARRVREEDGE